MKQNIKLICFDVCGTLVDGISWLTLTRALGCSEEKHLDLFRRAKKGEFTFVEAEKKLTQMYRESGNATKSFIKNLFSTIKPYPEAPELITYLRKKEYRIYLISGAIDIFVEAIAKKLHVDGFYANSTLEFDEYGVLRKIHYRDNQGEVKVEQLKELASKLEVGLDDVAFVGDSDNDVDVFNLIPNGIAVHSESHKLKRCAWKTVDTLSEIKQFL